MSVLFYPPRWFKVTESLFSPARSIDSNFELEATLTTNPGELWPLNCNAQVKVSGGPTDQMTSITRIDGKLTLVVYSHLN